MVGGPSDVPETDLAVVLMDGLLNCRTSFQLVFAILYVGEEGGGLARAKLGRF